MQNSAMLVLVSLKGTTLNLCQQEKPGIKRLMRVMTVMKVMKFMKFINRNAYILTAINGTNFCSSAKEAFGLILRNCVRVVVLDKVIQF